MKKLIYFVGIPVVVIFLGVFIGAWYFLSHVLNENFLVQQIESNLNVRAEVKKLNVSLFSIMSSVELDGVSLAARDSYANSGAELSTRPPIAGSVLSIGKVDLKFSFLPLLARRFELKRFLLREPQVQLTLFADGSNSLTPLFKKPLIVAGKPNPALVEKTEEKEEKDEEPSKPFSAKDLPISANLKEIGIKSGNAAIRMQQTGQLIKISGLDLVISEIDIDPAALEKHDSVKVNFDANVGVVARSGADAAGLLIRSGGNVTPFDPKTGLVNTNVVYDVVVKKDSYATGMAMFDQLGGSLPMLNKVGFSWKKLGDKAVLTRDVDVKVSYSHGLVTFLEDAAFPTVHYDLLLKKGSTLNTTTNIHNFNASVRASEAESNEVLQNFDRGLEKKAKGQDVTKLRNRILGKLVSNNRVELPFASAGNFADPQVTLLAEIPSLAEVLAGTLEDKLGDKLKQVPGGQAAKDLLKKLPF